MKYSLNRVCTWKSLSVLYPLVDIYIHYEDTRNFLGRHQFQVAQDDIYFIIAMGSTIQVYSKKTCQLLYSLTLGPILNHVFIVVSLLITKNTLVAVIQEYLAHKDYLRLQYSFWKIWDLPTGNLISESKTIDKLLALEIDEFSNVVEFRSQNNVEGFTLFRQDQEKLLSMEERYDDDTIIPRLTVLKDHLILQLGDCVHICPKNSNIWTRNELDINPTVFAAGSSKIAACDYYLCRIGIWDIDFATGTLNFVTIIKIPQVTNVFGLFFGRSEVKKDTWMEDSLFLMGETVGEGESFVTLYEVDFLTRKEGSVRDFREKIM